MTPGWTDLAVLCATLGLYALLRRACYGLLCIPESGYPRPSILLGALRRRRVLLGTALLVVPVAGVVRRPARDSRPLRGR